MVIIKGAFPVRAECRERALALVQALAQASRQEPGCSAYEVYCDAQDNLRIMVLQEWSSLADLEIHFGTDHVDAFLDAIADMLDGDITSVRYDVHHIEGESSDEESSAPASLVLADNITLH